MTTALVLAAAMAHIAPSFHSQHGRQELHAIALQLTAYGRARNIEPELLAAVAMRESTFRRDAQSTFPIWRGKGRNRRVIGEGHSTGVMGIKETTTLTSADLTDLATNVSVGARLLAEAIKACRGDVANGLTAFNRGIGKHAKNCKASSYSDEVLDFYQRIVAAVAAREERR